MEKLSDEVLVLNELMESKLEFPNAILLCPYFLPTEIYHAAASVMQHKYGAWYNFSGVYAESTQKVSSPLMEIIMFLFGGIGLIALIKAIENRDRFLANVDQLKGALPNFKKIAPEQSLFIRKTFGKTKPRMYGIVGSDEVRYPPERKIAKAPLDKFRKAEQLQLDEFGKDLIAVLTSSVLFGEARAGRVEEDKKRAWGRIKKANVHSSGGPVPNLFTGHVLRQVEGLEFDLKNGLYPLKTKNFPNGLVPQYDPREKTYYDDYGVILWRKSNPFNANFSSLSTFGCHGYGSLAAARAITDFESGTIEVDKGILKNMLKEIEKGTESFYVIVRAELGWIEGNWDIKKIELFEGPLPC